MPNPGRYATEPHPLLTPVSLDSHVSFEACGDHFRYRVTVAEVKDVWTFAREVRSRDPNWRLVATEADD